MSPVDSTIHPDWGRSPRYPARPTWCSVEVIAEMAGIDTRTVLYYHEIGVIFPVSDAMEFDGNGLRHICRLEQLRQSHDLSDSGLKLTAMLLALFVEIFKTYPDTDFREYDYIIANMPRIGNTAFGERDDIAIPYRGEKLNVAMNISSASHTVLAHEVGHLMGLPDLYTYGGVKGPKNPAGPWDIMSSAGQSTGFFGWHRHKLKWLDADRKAYLTKSANSLELTPLSASSGVSMVVVPVDDPARPSKVFVIEVAQPLQPKTGMKHKAVGVLVYSVDATLASGQNPVVVYPRLDMNNAAFHAGDSLDHKDVPFRLKVLKRNASGGYSIDLQLKD